MAAVALLLSPIWRVALHPSLMFWLLAVFVLVLARTPPAASFGLVHHERHFHCHCHCHPRSRAGSVPHKHTHKHKHKHKHNARVRPPSPPSLLLLWQSDNDDYDPDNDNDRREPPRRFPFADANTDPDRGLWASDALAIVLASQLIGLSSVVNDPEFLRNGGWFQPIGVDAVPSTLGDLVQRISSLGISWIIASFVAVSVASAAKANGNGRATNGNDEYNNDASVVLVGRNLPTLVVFGIVQGLGTLALLGLQEGGGFGGGSTADGLPDPGATSTLLWLDVLRNCYYVGLTTSGLRYLYGRYFGL